MISNKPALVSFEPDKGTFRGYLSIEVVLGSEKRPEILLQKAIRIYENALTQMAAIIFDIKNSKKNRTRVAARKIWQLGNFIFRLLDELKEIDLEIDGIYDHLSRDLGVKKKWLEKVIIFRRYIPDVNIIPKSLNWGRLEKGTRRKADRLRKGLALS